MEIAKDAEAMKCHVCLYCDYIILFSAIGLTDISIQSETGRWTVTVGHNYEFICLVDCTPSCNYTWTFEGKTFSNDVVHVPVFHKGEKPMTESIQQIPVTKYHRTEPLTCTAQNTISGVVISKTQILTIISKCLKRKYTHHASCALTATHCLKYCPL